MPRWIGARVVRDPGCCDAELLRQKNHGDGTGREIVSTRARYHLIHASGVAISLGGATSLIASLALCPQVDYG